MTDSEKLDLLISKIGKVDELSDELKNIKLSLNNLENEVKETKLSLNNLENEVKENRLSLNNLENEVKENRLSLNNLENEVKENRLSLNNLRNDVRDIKLTLENEIRTSIMRIAEGHLDLSRNLAKTTQLDNEKEMIAIRVSILETEMRRVKEQVAQIA